MTPLKYTSLFLFPALAFAFAAVAAEVPAHLPGELSADEVLNGAYPFPDSPKVEVREDWSGFAKERLSKVPAPGEHPRILLSPSDLPGLRKRLKETNSGRELMETLRARVQNAIRKPGDWGTKFFDALASDDKNAAKKLLAEKQGKPPGIGHYQPWIYTLVMESFDAMVSDDLARGKKVAAAIATYAALAEPAVKYSLGFPMQDDVWRVKVTGPVTGSGISDQGVRDLVGYHNLGYAYDFAYNFMTDEQRDQVRRVIALATNGELWMGCRLPHHFRNWNWIAVGLGQPLLALSIEGEKGYDPRVYKLGMQIARDYLTYGISEKGCSTEAVGYTQFGLVWANPFFIAASRRGDNLLVQNHYRAMVDWYLQSMNTTGEKWMSHGDGGVTGPSVPTMMMWKYFYPDDAKVDFVWRNALNADGHDQLKERIHIIEPLIFCSDGLKDKDGKSPDYAAGAKLAAPLTWFDPTRSSLIARDKWSADSTMIEFECRTDSVGGSHEHADRGSFTFAALGRVWAKENFRSVETKFHNSILIDGMGQGFWPGPGEWLGLEEKDSALIAACNAKEAYSWWWPKQAGTEAQDFARYQFPRWESYRDEAEKFRKDYGPGPFERDPRPSVVAHWKGFVEKGDPRMWDEDSWPIRLPHNPVQRAFRTLVFSKGKKPWLLVVDDIQKDDSEHLYEWLMQTDMNTEVASIDSRDIVLCDATVRRDENGVAKPAKGDRALLVRVLEMSEPAKEHDYQSRPATRLETFERKDTLVPEADPGKLSGSRSYGLDKRLVIASRSIAPNFKILLFPFRIGDPLPFTTWNADHTQVTLSGAGTDDTISFIPGSNSRTRVAIKSGGESITLK